MLIHESQTKRENKAMNPYEIERDIDDDEFEEIMDEINEEVNILGIDYGVGYLLRQIDPIWFNCAKLEYEADLSTQWGCSECDSIYDYFEDAEDCCSES